MADQGIVRICADCKHYRRAIFAAGMFYEPARCVRPIGVIDDIIVGPYRDTLHAECRKERRDGATFWKRRPRCGRLAQFFEPAGEPAPGIERTLWRLEKRAAQDNNA